MMKRRLHLPPIDKRRRCKVTRLRSNLQLGTQAQRHIQRKIVDALSQALLARNIMLGEHVGLVNSILLGAK